jgi:hypothetical protein
MSILRSLLDPITHRTYDFRTTTEKEEHLWHVLTSACYNQCPPDTADYLCEREEAVEDNELLQCAKCYALWGAKVPGASTQTSQRLAQAIELAVLDKCPHDKKDWVCLATEDESTDEDVCAMCLQRWATIPFAKFRK